MNELYIGLMSGTSADGIDAALVDFNSVSPKLLHCYYHKFSSTLRQTIIELCQSGVDEIKRMGDLDIALGYAFAEAVHMLLERSQTSFKQIRAIGCHGQTIRHYPERGYTLQVGDPNIITAKTNIMTITDFRRRDMAQGGQGAPLVPAFHQAVFAKKGQNRAIVNIGGIANITFLFGNELDVLGFDTGPGNILLDVWIEKHLQKNYDQDGGWANKGQVNYILLEELLNDPFFHLPPPKSTGREYFNFKWLESYISTSLSAVDVQATLVALTAQSIVRAVKQYFLEGEIIICGGGVHNKLLMDHLRKNATPLSVFSSNEFGIDPDQVEAMAFAWLAKQTLSNQTGNLTAVTGANRAAILGGIYHA